MRLAIIALLLVHSWYGKECCSDGDCHPVPCDQISRDKDGDYIWTRGPRDTVMFPKIRMKESQDEACHVCVHNEIAPAGNCLYLPVRV